MGNLIFFEDHHPGLELKGITRQRLKGHSLIPIQLALNEYDIEKCFAMLSSYGKCAVYPRANDQDQGRILFLVSIDDAIALNQQLLETDEEEQAIAARIDLIQMLENCEESLLGKAWDRIGPPGAASDKTRPGSISHVGQ